MLSGSDTMDTGKRGIEEPTNEEVDRTSLYIATTREPCGR
ncbi:hypothetical protein EP10_000546 [Geobacillus icigianus]|uniref:Uncharacterized protein n=1 Tax=Geobacillus icigianus TaxID=1430331 RepID=A0ABU6BE28_9BACL|nr:hypothetical protein [Geobacillus icigianus]MEB3749703.1 hypothetical protein [Geobacillus icigianus]MEB3749707.1 hypothetical protein [Geobacillus icigianus]